MTGGTMPGFGQSKFEHLKNKGIIIDPNATVDPSKVNFSHRIRKSNGERVTKKA